MILNILTSPLASFTILVIGGFFFQTFISLTLATAGYSEFYIGITHTAYYTGLLISSLYSEYIILRIGHIRTFAVFASLITATIISQAFTIYLPIWITARFLAGISLGALFLTIESWLLSDSTPINRGKRLALYMILYYCGQAIAPQLLHLVNLQSVQPYLMAAIFCALASIPVCMTHNSAPVLPEHQPLKVAYVFKLNPYGFLGCAASGIIVSQLYAFLPLYAKSHGFSVENMMSSWVIGGFALQLPLGKLSDHLPRAHVLTGLLLLSIIPFVFLSIISHDLLAYFMIFLVGGLIFTIYPISIALVCDHVDNKSIIQATGVLLFSNSLGALLGPITASTVIDYFNSLSVLFVFSTIVSSLLGLYGLYQYLLRKQPILEAPEAEQVEFTPHPQQTTVGNQLDPNVEPTQEETYAETDNLDNF